MRNDHGSIRFFYTFCLHCEFVWSGPGLLWWGMCGQINKHPWALSDWVIGSDLRARVLFRVFQVPRFFNFCFLISLKLSLFYKMLWHQASVFSPSVINDHSDDSGLGLLLLNLRESFAKSPNPWKNGHVYTCPVYVYIHCMAVKNWASIQWSRR